MHWEDPTIDTLIGENVRSVRRDRGLTQVELADRLEGIGYAMTERVIQSIESGTRAARVSEAVAFAYALQVSPVKLLMPQSFHRHIRLGDGRTSLPAGRLAWWMAHPDEDPPPAPRPEADTAPPARLVAEWLTMDEILIGCTSLHQHGDALSLALLREEIDRHRADAAMITTDPDLRIQSWNRGAEDLFGWTAREVVGESLAILHPDRASFDAFATALRAQAGADEIWREQRASRVRKTSAPIEVGTVAQAIRERGEIVGFACVARTVAAGSVDATDATAHGVAQIRIASDGTITDWSKEAEELYGWTADEIVGQPIVVLTPTEHNRTQRTRGIVATMQHLERNGRVSWPAVERVDKDGTRLTVAAEIVAEFDTADRLVAAVERSRRVPRGRQAPTTRREARA